MSTEPLSRRHALGLAVGAAAVLSGCGTTAAKAPAASAASSAAAAPSASAAAAGVMPAYVPYTNTPPDFPASANGVPPAYTKFPSPIGKVGKAPLKLSAPINFLINGDMPKTPMDRNAWVQAINTDLGQQCPMTFADWGDTYAAKLQTVIASNAIPEVTMVIPIPSMTQAIKAKFTDLTPFLAGDKVKDYPGLANIPPATWKMGMIDGKIYGIFQPRPIVGRALSAHMEPLEKKGIKGWPTPANGDELLSLCKEINDPANGVFAMGQHPTEWLLPYVLNMMGAPNVWGVDSSGKFTSYYEVPEMEAALEQTKKIWDAKVLHPNSYSAPNNLWWENNVTVLTIQQFMSVFGSQASRFNTSVIPAPKWAGGGIAPHWTAAPGYYSGVYISKQSKPERVVEALKAVDYLASPFGTEEFMKVVYGVQDKHYTLENNVIKPTPLANDERPGALWYCGAALNNAMFIPGKPDVVKQYHQFASTIMANQIANPTIGLFSETQFGKGAAATKKIYDTQSEIIQGRQPLTAWAQAVKDWKSAAGDAMKREYEEAYAANK